MPKRTKQKRSGKQVKVATVKHTSKRGALRATTRTPATTTPTTRETLARESFRTIQIQNVPADEVQSVIAEERATRDVVSAHALPESDGEFTVVIVYRTA
jgi:hypothetical protein